MNDQDKEKPKTSYPLSILPDSKKDFQRIRKRDKKVAWQLFRDMIAAYEQARTMNVTDGQKA